MKFDFEISRMDYICTNIGLCVRVGVFVHLLCVAFSFGETE